MRPSAKPPSCWARRWSMRLQPHELHTLLHSNPDLRAEGDNRQPAKIRFATEHQFQAALFARLQKLSAENPIFALAMAIPNGQVRKGQRLEPGILSGAPDIFFPYP